MRQQSPTRAGSATLMPSASYAAVQAPMTMMAPASWAGAQQSLQAGHSFVPPAATSFLPPAKSFSTTHSFVPPPTTMPTLGPTAPYAHQFATPRLSAGPPQAAMLRPFQGTPFNANRNSQAANPDCQNAECLVEEECNGEECGDETRGPREENKVCGMDKRPLLPCALAGSTMAGGAFMIYAEFPIMEQAFQRPALVEGYFLVLFGVTLVCMAYSALFDPGQVNKSDKASASLMPVEPDPADDKQSLTDEDALPPRAHQSWMYARPIRRYDHYCRWVVNVIGLLNHREFLLMVAGLALISVTGFFADAALMVHMVLQGGSHALEAGVGLHAAYSLILGYTVLPIFRLHVGFVARNELAQEWKRNTFYVLPHRETGQMINVNELDDEEYNERLETATYDKTRNVFDHGNHSGAGWLHNCAAFWCTPRWSPDQDGAF